MANNIRYSIRSKIDIRLNTGADRSRHGGHSQVRSRPGWATIPINVVCCLLLETGLSVSTASQTNANGCQLFFPALLHSGYFLLNDNNSSFCFLRLSWHWGTSRAFVHCHCRMFILESQTLRHSIHCKRTLYFNCATKRSFNQLKTMATF